MPKPILQAGAIPYTLHDGKLRFIIITPKQTDNVWIMPKGNIEPGLGPSRSATLEALEEAGVKGVIATKPLGSYDYNKDNRTYRVKMYPLKVTKTLKSWDEDSVRKRRIVKRKDAVELIDQPSIATLIDALAKKLKKPGKDS